MEEKIKAPFVKLLHLYMYGCNDVKTLTKKSIEKHVKKYFKRRFWKLSIDELSAAEIAVLLTEFLPLNTVEKHLWEALNLLQRKSLQCTKKELESLMTSDYSDEVNTIICSVYEERYVSAPDNQKIL